MMRVISISFVFSKQFRLVLRVIPLQNQLTRSSEALDDGTDWLGLEGSTSNLPRCSRYNLFTFEKPGFSPRPVRLVSDLEWSNFA